MNKLKLGISIAALIGCIGLTLLMRSYWIAKGASQVQALWDAQVAELVKAAAKEERNQLDSYIQEDSKNQEENERNKQDDYNRIQIMQTHINELGVANDSLQHALKQQRTRVRALSAKASNTNTCAAPDDPTSDPGQLLAKCSAQYSGVAADADRLSNQVMGLQQYATLCIRYGTPARKQKTRGSK